MSSGFSLDCGEAAPGTGFSSVSTPRPDFWRVFFQRRYFTFSDSDMSGEKLMQFVHSRISFSSEALRRVSLIRSSSSPNTPVDAISRTFDGSDLWRMPPSTISRCLTGSISVRSWPAPSPFCPPHASVAVVNCALVASRIFCRRSASIPASSFGAGASFFGASALSPAGAAGFAPFGALFEGWPFAPTAGGPSGARSFFSSGLSVSSFCAAPCALAAASAALGVSFML